MRVASVTLRDFRGYESAAAALGETLTVVCGPNGAGKTNLLEAVYFGCTGRSCRTSNEREVVRFGAAAARVTVEAHDHSGRHQLAVGFAPGEAKRATVDGAPVERLQDDERRPLLSVFLPDRLELVKGVPALRRAHLDHYVSALWPARSANRRAYSQALAQRNALIARIRAGHDASRSALTAWDAQLAKAGIALMADRRQAVELTRATFSDRAERLGLDGEPAIAYRPRSRATGEAEFAEELKQRLDQDLERGFTTHGPHRDDLRFSREHRELRTYGSQGQQRLGLLALLLAEREVIGAHRPATPLLLLDDVMSELDRARREALIELLKDGGGQSLITTTDLEHVPGADHPGIQRLEVRGGHLVQELQAA